MSARPDAASAPTPRTLLMPAAALHALRAALLDVPNGERLLRDAGHEAGRALYDDFAARVRASLGAEPAELPFPRFASALGDYFGTAGWGSVVVDMRAGDDAIHVHADEWAESDTGADPMDGCHFSTGLLAGCFGRAAGRPLTVLEIACRSVGAARCEFAIGSRSVIDALWRRLAPNG